MEYPTLTQQYQVRVNTETFRGYNRNLRIAYGEWYDERNLSAAHFPLFSQREKRGVVRRLEKPLGMLGKEELVYIDGSRVVVGGVVVHGLTLSVEADMLPKQIVSMGVYAVIFPDKVYVNTVDTNDCGSLEAAYKAFDTDDVKLEMCRADGSAYEDVEISAEAPSNPASGQLWIDISGDAHVLKQYSGTSAMWITVATTYVKISSRLIGDGFSTGDCVRVSGIAGAGSDAALDSQLEALNGEHIIEAMGDGYIVITGMLDRLHAQEGGLELSRECPDMDYVTESGNRIWGCRYGSVNGEPVNEIYACKLGDFRNWRCYAGLSTDSYAVSVGSDSRFTGAITYLGYPMFFKENCIHKIYGSMPGEYTMNTTSCRGVQEHCWRSLAIVNGILYYRSTDGIMAYDGSMPVSVSEALGSVRYENAAAGSDGDVYYISMMDPEADETWHMFTYDTVKRIWHREDETRALCFANLGGELMYIDAYTGELISARGKSGEAEPEVEWYAESGIQGYEYPDSKYVSRYSIRARLGAGARLTLAIEYDSDGVWNDMGTYVGSEITRTLTIPVIPRRCDHLRLRLSGAGDVKIYSIARYLEGGSEHWL